MPSISVRFSHLLPLLLVAMACARAPSPATGVAGHSPLARPLLAADSSRSAAVAAGVTHSYYWMSEGPWAVHVLDVDRAHCWTLGAAKGAVGAVGRSTPTAITTSEARRAEVVAGVNADFFLFAPPGVPTGPHIADGLVVAGPAHRPSVYVDSAGTVRLGVLRATGWAVGPDFGMELTGWNRPNAGGVSLFDAAWGTATDSATGAVEAVVSARQRGLVLAIDTTAAGVAIPPDGAVLVVGRAAPAVLRMQLATLRPGIDSLDLAIALTPTHPLEAVGGFPILVRDSMEVAGLDSAGGARFGPVRHPRTAIGIAEGGRRIILVVVDGRQPPYSAGMTLRELARLMLALGATDALNLDGGGSSAMAIVPRRGRPARVVNRPSDAAGERAVGNVLVVARDASCAARSR